jgi:hypothetical protein
MERPLQVTWSCGVGIPIIHKKYPGHQNEV